MDRIEAIERSLRCFTLGLLGLVPLIGIPAAALAYGEFRRVRQGYRGCWNPARTYLAWGAVFAHLTLLLTVLALGFLLLAIISQIRF